MSASSRCHHPETSVVFVPTKYAEEGVVVLTVQEVGCRTCGARFQFRGLADYPSPSAPWASNDGFSAALPMIEIDRPHAIS